MSERLTWKKADSSQETEPLTPKAHEELMLPTTCVQGHRSFPSQASGVTTSLAA